MELLGLGVLLLFGLILVILWTRGVFARDLTRALRRVTDQEEALQEKAAILEQRLAQMERDYQAKLKRAEAEAERVVQQAKGQAMNVRTVAIEEAKHRARQLLLEAEQGKGQLRADVARELNGQATQRACAALRALLPDAMRSQVHATLMQELLEAVQALDGRRLHGRVEGIAVTAAAALTAEESTRLAQWSQATLGKAATIQAVVDPELVAGGMIRLGETTLDNSLATRLGRHGQAAPQAPLGRVER